MMKRIRFLWDFPKILRAVSFGLTQASSVTEAYRYCCLSMPASAQYFFDGWITALRNQNQEKVSQESERLWHLFYYSPLVRMVINLLFLLPYVWDRRDKLNKLLWEISELGRIRIALGNVSDIFLLQQFLLMNDRFPCMEAAQLFLYQLPKGKLGKRMKRHLQDILLASNSDFEEQGKVFAAVSVGSVLWGEMNLCSNLAMSVFLRKKMVHFDATLWEAP